MAWTEKRAIERKAFEALLARARGRTDMTEDDRVKFWSDLLHTMEKYEKGDYEYFEHIEGRDFEDDMKNVDSLSLDECFTWLTFIWRADRHSGGQWFDGCFDDGHITALLERICELYRSAA